MREETDMSAQDDRLIEELRALATRVDPPPELLAEFARAALGWRTLDAELAELTYDSATDDSLVGAVRGATRAPRLLTFHVGEVTVEVEVQVMAQGTQRRLIGQLVPMQPARIEIRHSHGVTTAQVDDLGRFSAEGLPAGPISLRCHVGADEARIVHTDWLAI